MSSTQIELGRIDAKAVIASFNHNMHEGRKELVLVMKSNTNDDREEHLNKAKYHFMNAVRNAQGVINPRSKEGIEFLNRIMLNEAVSELCGTLNKSTLFNWKDTKPLLNIAEIHTKDPRQRREYNIWNEFGMIDAIDCGNLSKENKRDIAAHICACLDACLSDFTLSSLKRKSIDIDPMKEILTYAKLARHYNLPEHKDKAFKIMFMVRGMELADMSRLIYG